MKSFNISIIILFYSVSFIIFLNGCAPSSTINLLKEQTVTVNKKNLNDARIGFVKLVQDGDVLSVSGTVLLRNKLVRGHVDIVIYSIDGSILKKTSTHTILKKRSIRRGVLAKRTAFFSVDIPVVPPKGSDVRIAYHKRGYNVPKSFDCGKNVAITD